MGLDLWFREDVMRILASTQETMRASTTALPSASSEVAGAYQRGFLDALRAVGIAFGVVPPAIPGPAWPARGVQTVDGESSFVHRDRQGPW